MTGQFILDYLYAHEQVVVFNKPRGQIQPQPRTAAKDEEWQVAVQGLERWPVQQQGNRLPKEDKEASQFVLHRSQRAKAR